MSIRTGRIISFILVAVFAAFIFFSVATGLPVYYPLIAVVITMLLIRLIRRCTKEITVDERLRTVNEKAAAISYRIFSFTIAILSVILISLSNHIPEVFNIIGQTLAYSAGAFMLIHMGFYYYYAHKY